MRNFYEFSSFQSNPDFKITAGNCTRLFSPLFAFPTISIDTKEYETLLKKSFYICTYLIALEQLISTEIPPRVILPNGKNGKYVPCSCVLPHIYATDTRVHGIKLHEVDYTA